MDLKTIPLIKWFDRDRERYLEACLVVFILSALVSLLFLALLPHRLNVNTAGDFIGFYEPLARNILAGGGLTDSSGHPALRWPPGYPIMLAGLFSLAQAAHLPEMTVIIIFNILCVGLSSVVLFLMAKKIWQPQYAFLSAAGFMTYPIGLWLLKQPSVDIPFILIFFMSVWLLMSALIRKDPHWYSFFFSGLLVGISMLIRPVAIVVPFAMAPLIWFFIRHATAARRFSFICLMLLGVMIAIGPWEAWIYQRTQKVLLLTSGGMPCVRDGLIFGIARKYRIGLALPQDVEALMRHFLDHFAELNSMGRIVSAVIDQFWEHPAAVLKMLFLKIIRAWYGTDSNKFENIILLIQAPYYAAFFWSTKNALQAGASLRWLAVGIWVFILCFWGITFLVTPILRFMIPAIGLLFLLLPAISNKWVQLSQRLT